MERGFTLIELLIVVAIIGVLAAIAIPQFASYKAKGNNSIALADLRNAITAQEAYFIDADAYQGCTDAGCNDPALPGFELSDGVSIQMLPVADEFTATAVHDSGSYRFNFSSATGAVTTTAP